MPICEVEFLEALVNSGLHGRCWPSNVYGAALQTVCGDNVCYMAKNTRKTEHAEDDVLAYLEELLEGRNLQDQEIKLFLSASPCQRCSHRIVRFLEGARRDHNVQLRMEIVFSAFYRVRRPSCERNPGCCDHLPSDEDHRAQVRGLWRLYCTPGVELRTFHHRDWLHLERALGVYNINFRGRRTEDDLLRNDFEQILLSCSMHHPRLDLSTYQPQVDPSTDQPRVSQSNNQPRFGLSADPSTIGLSTDQPWVSLSSYQPQVNLSNSQPLVGLSTNQPRASMLMAQPQVGLSNNLPQVGLTSDQPQEGLTINEMTMSLSTAHRRKKLSAYQSNVLLSSDRSSTFNSTPSMFSFLCFIVCIVIQLYYFFLTGFFKN